MSETEHQFIGYVMGWSLIVLSILFVGKYLFNSKSESEDEKENW